MMFERFTPDARRIVVDAQFHARRLDHRYIGTEHLLLALVSTQTDAAAVLRGLGVAADAVEAAVVRLLGTPHQNLDRDALASIGIDLDQVRERAEAGFGPTALRWQPQRRSRDRWRGRRRARCGSPSGHIPFTPRAKKCLELSLREALALKHRRIDAEHIALGVLRVNDGLAGRVLEMLGISAADVRGEILRRQRLAG